MPKEIKVSRFFTYTPDDFKPIKQEHFKDYKTEKDNNNKAGVSNAQPPSNSNPNPKPTRCSKIKNESSTSTTTTLVKTEQQQDLTATLLPDLDEMDIEETIENSRRLLEEFQGYVNYQVIKRQLENLEAQLHHRDETIQELEQMMNRQQNQLYLRNLEIEQLKEQQKDILSLLDRRTAVLVATVKTNETNINKLALDFKHIMDYIKFKKQPPTDTTTKTTSS